MTPFGKWLQLRDISYADAARELGVSRAYTQALAVGKATPRLKSLGAQIEAWTRSIDPVDFVAVASWLPFCAQFEGLKLT